VGTNLSYVRQSLTPGEKLIHVGQFHWFYTLNAILGLFWGFIGTFIFLGVVVVGEQMMHTHTFSAPPSWMDAIRNLHPGLKLCALMVFVFSLMRFTQMMIIRASTEIAVTSTRIIYKRGLVARYVGEMSIDRIEGINVLQTMAGRIFGYGRLLIRGMGVGEVILPPIADPIAFRKAIEMAKVST